MSYMCNNENACNATGWGVGLSAIIGGALGYWAGRSNNCNGFGCNGAAAFPAAAYAAGAAGA